MFDGNHLTCTGVPKTCLGYPNHYDSGVSETRAGTSHVRRHVRLFAHGFPSVTRGDWDGCCLNVLWELWDSSVCERVSSNVFVCKVCECFHVIKLSFSSFHAYTVCKTMEEMNQSSTDHRG